MRKSILIITALLMTKTKTTITYLMVVITILFLSCTSKQQSEVPTGEMFDEATVSFAKAYTFLRKWMETDTTGKDMPRIILRLDNIATSYIHTSEYAKAKMWLDREDSALAIYSQKPNVVEKQADFLKGTIQLDFAAMCQQLGQSEEAHAITTSTARLSSRSVTWHSFGTSRFSFCSSGARSLLQLPDDRHSRIAII